MSDEQGQMNKDIFKRKLEKKDTQKTQYKDGFLWTCRKLDALGHK